MLEFLPDKVQFLLGARAVELIAPGTVIYTAGFLPGAPMSGCWWLQEALRLPSVIRTILLSWRSKNSMVINSTASVVVLLLFYLLVIMDGEK